MQLCDMDDVLMLSILIYILMEMGMDLVLLFAGMQHANDEGFVLKDPGTCRVISRYYVVGRGGEGRNNYNTALTLDLSRSVPPRFLLQRLPSVCGQPAVRFGDSTVNGVHQKHTPIG